MNSKEVFRFMLSVAVDPEIFRTIDAYAKAAKSEISAIGEISTSPDGTRVQVYRDLHFFSQRASWGEVDLDMEDVQGFLHDQLVLSGTTARFKLWFHTHPGSVFFSPKDLRTIETLGGFFLPVVAVCANSRGETIWRVVTGRDGRWAEFQVDIPQAQRSTEEEVEKAKVHLSKIVRVESAPWEGWSVADVWPWYQKKIRGRKDRGPKQLSSREERKDFEQWTCEHCEKGNSYWRVRCWSCQAEKTQPSSTPPAD